MKRFIVLFLILFWLGNQVKSKIQKTPDEKAEELFNDSQKATTADCAVFDLFYERKSMLKTV